MVVGLLGNESSGSNRFILVTPKPENGVRLQATLGNQNPTGLPVGAVRRRVSAIRRGIRHWAMAGKSIRLPISSVVRKISRIFFENF